MNRSFSWMRRAKPGSHAIYVSRPHDVAALIKRAANGQVAEEYTQPRTQKV
jgi:hypothetical protein